MKDHHAEIDGPAIGFLNDVVQFIDEARFETRVKAKIRRYGNPSGTAGVGSERRHIFVDRHP